MQVTLYDSSKKTDSTALPTGGKTVEAQLRNSNPVALLSPQLWFSPAFFGNNGLEKPPYNLVYIPKFGRYYYTEWTFVDGRWMCTTREDVLASWRSAIGDLDLYVLRSSAEFDGRVKDTKYPVLSDIQSFNDNIGTVTVTRGDGTTYQTDSLWNTPFEDGCYVMSVFGPNETGVSHYCCTKRGFKIVTDHLYSFDPRAATSGNWDYGGESLPEGWSKAIANPMQFIAGVKWYPVFPIDGAAYKAADVILGYYNLRPQSSILGIHLMTSNEMIVKCEGYFPIRKHPQSSRGTYLNAGECAQYSITIPPFGDFPLDSALIFEDDYVHAVWYTDFATGTGVLYLDAGGTFLGRIEAQVGVDVSLSQNTYDLTKAFSVSSLIQGVVGSSFSSGEAAKNMQGVEKTVSISVPMNPMNLKSGKFQGEPYPEDTHTFGVNLPTKESMADFGSAVVGGFLSHNPGMAPHIHHVGGVASYTTWGCGVSPKIHANFYLIADEDNASIGRPLCKVRKPKNLGGYILAQNPRVPLMGTKEETEAIRSFLSGGFFYE